MLTEEAGHMAAAMCRWLLGLAEFDRRGGWVSWGCRSAAHWLTFRCGVDLGTAREQVKVAGRLGDLPHVRQAFSQGALSWWQVRQIVRVATPDTEEQLLGLARVATTTQLTSIVGGLKRALAIEAGLHPRRSFRWYVDEDGFVVFSGRLGPDDGALVAKALDALVDDLLRAKQQKTREAGAHVPDQPEDPPGDAHDAFGATRADALVRMARLALAAFESNAEIADRAQVVIHVDQAVLTNAAGAHSGGRESPVPRDAADCRDPGVDPSGSGPPSPASSEPERPDSERPDSERPDSERPESPIAEPQHRLAADHLAAIGGGHSEGRCEIEGGSSIPDDTALRLACDASVVRLVEDRDGNPLDVGRKTRTIGPALRRALRSRDGGCRFPGCPEIRFVEGHHLRHWAHGGTTSLGNLTELCRFHHRLLHEGGYRIEGTAPELRFFRPDGTPIEHPRSPGPCDGNLRRANRAEGLAIDAGTIVSGWSGERLRLGYVVSCVVGSRDTGPPGTG